MIPKLRIFLFKIFIRQKETSLRKNALVFRELEKFCVSRWIGNHILPHFDVFKFEIGPLKFLKIIFF